MSEREHSNTLKYSKLFVENQQIIQGCYVYKQRIWGTSFYKEVIQNHKEHIVKKVKINIISTKQCVGFSLQIMFIWNTT
jgi:hypothetical protein